MRAMKRRTLFLAAFAALLTLNAVLLLVQPGFALPNALTSYLLGPKMVKAEIVLKDGSGLHDYRLDHPDRDADGTRRGAGPRRGPRGRRRRLRHEAVLAA